MHERALLSVALDLEDSTIFSAVAEQVVQEAVHMLQTSLSRCSAALSVQEATERVGHRLRAMGQARILLPQSGYPSWRLAKVPLAMSQFSRSSTVRPVKATGYEQERSDRRARTVVVWVRRLSWSRTGSPCRVHAEAAVGTV